MIPYHAIFLAARPLEVFAFVPFGVVSESSHLHEGHLTAAATSGAHLGIECEAEGAHELWYGKVEGLLATCGQGESPARSSVLLRIRRECAVATENTGDAEHEPSGR
jgi:hypothetical protein